MHSLALQIFLNKCYLSISTLYSLAKKAVSAVYKFKMKAHVKQAIGAFGDHGHICKSGELLWVPHHILFFWLDSAGRGDPEGNSKGLCGCHVGNSHLIPLALKQRLC